MTVQAKVNMIFKKIQRYYSIVNTILHPLFQLSVRLGLYRSWSSLPLLLQGLMSLRPSCTLDFPSFFYTESIIHVRNWTVSSSVWFFFYVCHLSTLIFDLPNIVTLANLKLEPVRTSLALCRNKISESLMCSANRPHLLRWNLISNLPDILFRTQSQ